MALTVKPTLFRLVALFTTLCLGGCYVWWASARRTPPPSPVSAETRLMLSGSKSGPVVGPEDLAPPQPPPEPSAKAMMGSSKLGVIITPDQLDPKDKPVRPMISGSKSGRIFDAKTFQTPSYLPTPAPTPAPVPKASAKP